MKKEVEKKKRPGRHIVAPYNPIFAAILIRLTPGLKNRFFISFLHVGKKKISNKLFK